MNDEFLQNFLQIFRPKGLLTRDPGEPRETFEQLQQRALERERAEEAQRAQQAAPSPVRRDTEGLGDNELAAGRAPAVPPRRVNPLAESVEATPARSSPAERWRQDPSSRRAGDPLAPTPERSKVGGPPDEIETAMKRRLPGQRPQPPGFEHPGPITGRGSPRPAPAPKAPPQLSPTLPKLGRKGGDFRSGFSEWWNNRGRALTEARAKDPTVRIAPSQSFIWKNLSTKKGDAGLRWNRLGGNKRRFYTFDKGGKGRHQSEIEVFDGAKRHLGSMDALTGKMIKPRDPRKDNSIDVSEIDGPDNRRTV